MTDSIHKWKAPSLEWPGTITHVKRLDVNKGAIIFFEEFLDQMSPLRTAKKLSVMLRVLLLMSSKISNGL